MLIISKLHPLVPVGRVCMCSVMSFHAIVAMNFQSFNYATVDKSAPMQIWIVSLKPAMQIGIVSLRPIDLCISCENAALVLGWSFVWTTFLAKWKQLHHIMEGIRLAIMTKHRHAWGQDFCMCCCSTMTCACSCEQICFVCVACRWMCSLANRLVGHKRFAHI